MGKMMKKNNVPGFTLIEMVVVAGLVGFLTIGIVSVFIATMQGSARAKAQAAIKTQGDYAIASMERTLRNATTAPVCDPTGVSVTFPIKGSSITYSFGTAGQLLANDQVMIGGTGGVSVETGRFTCNEGDDFSFGTVGISMTLTGGDQNNPTNQVFQTTVAIRSIP